MLRKTAQNIDTFAHIKYKVDVGSPDRMKTLFNQYRDSPYAKLKKNQALLADGGQESRFSQKAVNKSTGF